MSNECKDAYEFIFYWNISNLKLYNIHNIIAIAEIINY